jgi:nucleotide-binding universal stress UspA family protein
MTAIETPRIENAPIANESQTALPTLIVATDGSPASTSAFTAANLIAKVNDVDVRVVSVLEPLRMPVAVPHAILAFEEMDSLRAGELAHRIRTQVKENELQDNAWPVENRVGVPAAEIAQSAQEHGAGLIIVGASRHGLLDRVMGEETASRIVQLGNIPLLVASEGIQRLPHRVAVAMDLDPSQLGDLPPVLSLFGPAARVACVHVQRRENFPGSDSSAFARAYESAVTESFGVTQAAISKVPGMRADLIRLSGDPATELLRYVEHAKVELLVLGLRRHYGLGRLLGGSVALKVLRDATCSILIVPESVGAAIRNDQKKGTQNTTLTTYDAAMWPSQLKQFTRRNAGRHATLEVDGPAVGAFVQVANLPFIGADYDHRDGRVEILLGDFARSERHFARSIPNPDSISVLRGLGSKDDALCVRYEGGQTLLTFRS